MKNTIKSNIIQMTAVLAVASSVLLTGCGTGGLSGYSHGWIYPENVQTVYVEMFNTGSFRRGHEYVLTDAICKYLEANSPYKIVSDRKQADSILYGNLSIISGIITSDRYTGTALENDGIAKVVFSWKDLKTGELMIDNAEVAASTTYSGNLGQSFDYASNQAMNKAALKVVERMEKQW